MHNNYSGSKAEQLKQSNNDARVLQLSVSDPKTRVDLTQIFGATTLHRLLSDMKVFRKVMHRARSPSSNISPLS